MKRISFLVGALLIAGCSQDQNKSSNVQEDKKAVEEKEELFTGKSKEFLKFAINNDFEALADGGEAQITEYFPLYTAEQITTDYGKNEIRANNLYKNKQFFITGKINSIEAGIDDKPVVSLKTKANYGFNSPLLGFNKIDQVKVADLNKGEKVTFLCTGKSEIAGTPVLGNCKFLETLEKEMIDDVLNFEDQDLSKGNSQYKQAVATYTLFLSGLSKASNDFENCKEFDNTCVENILKNTSKEEIQKVTEELKAQFPKANESLKNKISEE